MAEYNGFKIKRPHSLTPLTSVYEAEAVDGRPGRFALKIFHPPASTNVRRFYAIEGWLLAAERQQQSAKKDGTVVEVLACGRCAEGAFAVLPWQERFLEPWIKTLLAKGDTLRALATCLLNTIEAWEKETGGPHGNLKPANVFLDHSGPLTAMTAQLSDPAFLPGTKTESLRLADLNAVGTMLATIGEEPLGLAAAARNPLDCDSSRSQLVDHGAGDVDSRGSAPGDGSRHGTDLDSLCPQLLRHLVAPSAH